MSDYPLNEWSSRVRLWQHFREPIGNLPLKGADAFAETFDSSRVQQLRVEIVLKGPHIDNTAFKAFGGVALLACGSWLCQWLLGKTLADLQQLSSGELVERVTAELELNPSEKPVAFLIEDIVPLLCAAVEQNPR